MPLESQWAAMAKCDDHWAVAAKLDRGQDLDGLDQPQRSLVRKNQVDAGSRLVTLRVPVTERPLHGPLAQCGLDVNPRPTGAKEVDQQWARRASPSARRQVVAVREGGPIEIPKQQGGDLQVQLVRELGHCQGIPRPLKLLPAGGDRGVHGEEEQPQGEPRARRDMHPMQAVHGVQHPPWCTSRWGRGQRNPLSCHKADTATAPKQTSV